MRKWFDTAFGAVVQTIGHAIGDGRDRLVFESFFSRNVPERRPDSDLGWTQGDDRHGHGDDRSLLDRLFQTDPDLFSPDRETPSRDADRGIDFDR